MCRISAHPRGFELLLGTAETSLAIGETAARGLALAATEDAGLVFDSGMSTESHNDEIEAGLVIDANLPEETLRVGSAAALNVSLGPELVEIPDVKDLPLQEAMDLLLSVGGPAARLGDIQHG